MYVERKARAISLKSNIQCALFFVLLAFLFSACSPFGNSSLIESISTTVNSIFENKPAPAKASASGGQLVSNIAGYRMNVGVTNSSSRSKTTCNGQGYCMELGISR